jgi:hypothetical protein
MCVKGHASVSKGIKNVPKGMQVCQRACKCVEGHASVSKGMKVCQRG